MALSVEIKNMVIKAGKAISGKLTGAAFVDRGAFASAALMAAAVDVDDDIDVTTDHPFTDSQLEALRALIGEATKTPSAAPVEVTERQPAPNTERTDTVADAVVPSNLNTGDEQTPATLTASAVFAMQAEAAATGNRDLFAALSDVKISGTGTVGTNVVVPQWVGELWSGAQFQRKLVPLLGHADLTSLKISGFRWTVKPQVAPYAGNKAAVPSNQPATQPYEVAAQRLAGAHDIDRAFRDFDVPGFWDSYWNAMTESYLRQSDAGVATALTTAGAFTPIPRGTVPTGVSAAATAIVDGVIAIGDEGLPSFALVAPDLYRDFILTRKDDSLAFLDTQLSVLTGGSIGGFSVQASSAIPAGSVLVGSRNAATVYELPGAAPIRVEGLDVSKGGIDPSLHGYFATVINNPAALSLVAPGA